MPNRTSLLLACLVTATLLTTAFGADNKEAAPATRPASGLKSTVVSPGAPGAKTGDIALVLYTGKLQDGTVFDASAKHGNKPFQFTIGQGQVIKGWDQGIVGMTVGEKRTLVIPPDLAYGPEGRPPTIPANSTLTFDVQLVGLVRLPQEPKSSEQH